MRYALWQIKIMTYDEALKYIHGTYKFGSKLGLDNITKLMELLGNPQDRYSCVHIAGTNGKGSTAAFINSILLQTGLKTGFFTSPYLERFEERIRVNNECIAPEQLTEITELVKEKIEFMISRGYNHPTEFEIVTAIGFECFARNNCDVVVLEVGLGGRLDATNVIKAPPVSVITPISFDHTAILGDTLAKIAREKCGIIKKGSTVISHPQPAEAEAVIRETCAQRGAELVIPGFDSIKVSHFDIRKTRFSYRGYQLETSLAGRHQVYNAAVAVTASEQLARKGFNISGKHIAEGIAAAKWPGRMEFLSWDPCFFIDGAHNEAGARVLAENIEMYFRGRKVIFIFGVLRDKDYMSMIRQVSPHAQAFITVTPPVGRALPAEELALILKDYCKTVIVSDTIESAIRTSCEISDQNSVICAFGSLYFIGEIRKYFNQGKMPES